MLGRLIWAAAALVILALDWAALHDILKGEPDLILEWGILAASIPGLLWTGRRAVVRIERRPA